MAPQTGILIFFHCNSNTGYAIGRLESVFFDMAQRIAQSSEQIHFGYLSLCGGLPAFLPADFKNITEFNPADGSAENKQRIYNYLEQHKITVAFGFDQPVWRPCYKTMRDAGLRLFISYWGAPMSSINHGLVLNLKQLEVKLRRNKPDHFIFESKAMADTAIFGRGIDPSSVTVIPTGVNTTLFHPEGNPTFYSHDAYSIPRRRKLVLYSGHMEERKGVDVIIKAAHELVAIRGRTDVHFLFLGNAPGEEDKFRPLVVGTATEQHLTFGGYRNDINLIQRSCYLGVIASTGWDSFPMSSLEMAASGLPVVASSLQGIIETVDDGKTGFLVTPGNYVELADRIELLLLDQPLRHQMGMAGRKRVERGFSRSIQLDRLDQLMRMLCFRNWS